MKRIGLLTAVGVLCVSWAGVAQAQCVVDTSTPTYANGKFLKYHPCDANGNVKVTGGGGGGGGDGALLDGVSSAIKATVKNYTNSKPLATIPVNTSGDPAAYGAGTTGATTTRTAEATDSQLSVDIAAIKAALQLVDDDQVGATNKHYVSVGTTEDEVEVKAAAGRVMSIQVSNTASEEAYLRCAQLTAVNTTPGTSTVYWGMAIPGSTTGAGMTANFGPAGMVFTPALTCWVVTDKAETGVTEVAAGDVQWNIQYK